MQKTKLGISVPLLGAGLCFAAAFGGMVATIILVGYVLLREEDAWLRKTGVKAIATLIGFAFLSTVITYIPDVLTILENLCNIFDSNINTGKLNQIIYLVKNVLNLVESLVLVIMGCKALKYTEMNVPYVDKIVNNNM